MPTLPRAILFDMDGVLVRSEEVWFRLVEEAGQKFRGSAITREEFAPTFGQGTAADIEHFGLRCSVRELDAFYAEHFHRHLGATWVNPQAQPLLEALRERGMRLAVVTNTVSALAQNILQAARLRDYFSVLAGADQVARAKPAPDLVLHACRGLATAPAQAWMVGDSRFDRGAAQAAGVTFVGLGLEGDLRVEALAELTERLG